MSVYAQTHTTNRHKQTMAHTPRPTPAPATWNAAEARIPEAASIDVGHVDIITLPATNSMPAWLGMSWCPVLTHMSPVLNTHAHLYDIVSIISLQNYRVESDSVWLLRAP